MYPRRCFSAGSYSLLILGCCLANVNSKYVTIHTFHSDGYTHQCFSQSAPFPSPPLFCVIHLHHLKRALVLTYSSHRQDLLSKHSHGSPGTRGRHLGQAYPPIPLQRGSRRTSMNKCRSYPAILLRQTVHGVSVVGIQQVSLVTYLRGIELQGWARSPCSIAAPQHVHLPPHLS